MLTTLRKIIDLLSKKERRQFYFLLVMVLVMALLEMIGVASIAPFISVLANPEVVESNRYLAAIYNSFGYADIGSFLFFLGIVVFVALISSIAFKAFATYVLLRFVHTRDYFLSRKLVEGYLRQPYEWFLKRHSAELGKIVLSEVEKVVNYALLPMMLLMAHSAVAIVLLGLLIVVDPFLAVAVVTCLGIAYGVIYLLLRNYLGNIGEDRMRANGERFQVVQEAFGGIKDVKVYGLEGVLLDRFDNPAKRYAGHQAASQISSQLPRFAMEAVAFGGMLLVVLYQMTRPGGLQEALPVLAVYAFAGYRLMPALQNAYVQLANLRFADPALNALHAELAQLAPNEGGDVTLQNVTPMGLVNELKLENITYVYPDAERPALNNMTLEVSAYSTVGLVGATGSGKTTIVDLFLGLLRPQSGEVLVDGCLITADNICAWQRTIGYVPQHIYLTDDSVTANIAFGIPAEHINQTAVEHAARIANLHDFVIKDMPQGYETRVGERGVRLSGGQRQRIGIARALYHDPEILILDEATSALDNLTELAVMEAVNNLSHRKTIIIIAHRLSTVRACDNIFLLEQGQVVSKGCYDDLLDSSVQFRKMAEGF